MDLRDYLRTLAKRWPTVLICTVLGGLIALTISFLMTPTYKAQAQLFISVQVSADDVSGLNQGSTFTQQRVKSYAAIVDSPEVLDPVISTLGLKVTAQTLAKSVSANVPLDTVLINVSVIDTNPTQAAAIANEVSRQFAKTVSDLERPEAKSTSLVKASVTREASVPEAPVSPRKKLNVGLGLLLGLLAGIAIALLRESLDTTIKGVEDLDFASETLGRTIPMLGRIGKDDEAKRRPLIVHAQPHSTRAEAFRQVRTNLQFVDVDNPPRTIVITSPLPEEGKSTTAANLAITLAQAGLRVAIVEADLRRPKLADYLGVDNAAGLTDVLIGRASLDQVLLPWGGLPLSVLPSGPIAPNPSELLGSHTMLSLMHQLAERNDVVILDAPPLLPVTDAAVMAALADGALLVVRANRTKREQVSRAIEALTAVDARILGFVLTMTKERRKKGTYGYDYDYQYAASSGRKYTGNGKGSVDVVPDKTTKRSRLRR